MAEYNDLEQKCSEALRTLLKDSTNLQDFLAQAYKVIHQTSWEAYGGFVNTGLNNPQSYMPSHNIVPYVEPSPVEVEQ